jgi:hypothetical protein
MNLKKICLVGLLLCAFLAPTNVFAEKGKWSFQPHLGANVTSSRDMMDATTGLTSQADINFTDGSVLASETVVSLNDLDFEDTHNVALIAGFDIGYFITDSLEIIGGFQTVTADGTEVSALNVTTNGAFQCPTCGARTTLVVGDTATATFDDYNSWAIKIGATKYYPMGNFIPYIGGYGGFKHIDSMQMRLKFKVRSALNVESGNLNIYDETNTGFFGFHTGANKIIPWGTTPVSMGIRARLDWTPELDNDNSDLQKAGGGGANDTGSGVDLGLTVNMSIPF